MPERQTIPERLGHDFLRALYYMVNTVRMYKDNNQLVRAGVTSFQDILRELTAGGNISLLHYRSRFHIAGEKLPYRREAAFVVYNMGEFFSKRGIGSVNFLKSSQEASPEQIMTFIRLFNDAIRHDTPLQWLEQKLQENDFSWVQIAPRRDEDEIYDGDSEEHEKYEKARRNYFLAIEAVREVATKVSQGMVGIRKSRRVAQNFVDIIHEDASLMIGLTTIRDYDDYLYAHSVNVALLAMCLGRHIELSDISLEHLAICGLFHDLGKVDVPKEVLLKHNSLTDAEWDILKAHPVTGVRKILMLNANPALRSKIILGPFEHHLNLDMTGYPQTMFMGHLSLIGKILHIADVYEALTADTIYRPKSFAPNEALKIMWADAGKIFDKILLKRFIHMIGIYPIGSVVELSDGNIALVMDYPDEAERGLPLILRLTDGGNGNWQRKDMIYLADQTLKDEADRLNIVRVIPPKKVRLNPADFFLHLK